MKTQIQCFFSFCWDCAGDWVGLVSNCIAGLFGGCTAASWQPIRLFLCENLFPKESHNAIRYITDSVARTTSIRPMWSHDHQGIVNPFTYQNRLSHFLSIPENRHMWMNQRCCYTEHLSRSCESHPDIRQHLRIYHDLKREVIWAQHEMHSKIGKALKRIVCWGSFTRPFRHLIAKRKKWCVVGWRDLKLKV